MTTLEERVAFLEGRVEEHARGVDGIRDALTHLEVRLDGRFEAIDRRFEAIDARFSALEGTLVLRFDSMDTKIGRLTTAVLTALAATLAVVGGIAAALLR